MIEAQQSVKRRADGSIDATHYLDRGLRKRSETAHSLVATIQAACAAIIEKRRAARQITAVTSYRANGSDG